MKKKILTILAFFTSGYLHGQDIFSDAFNGVEDIYSLIYLQDGKSVEVKLLRTKEQDTTEDIRVVYYNENDTIQYKFFINDEKYYDSRLPCKSYNHYPRFIKVKNNQFKVSECQGDSILYDAKQRITEVYRKYSDAFTRRIDEFSFQYLNDTIILETIVMQEAEDALVYLFKLDKDYNLLSEKYANVNKSQINSSLDTNKVEFVKETKFNYDSHKKCIENIQVFDIYNNSWILRTTQYFIYKRKQPINSYIKNQETGAVEYKQLYEYKK